MTGSAGLKPRRARASTSSRAPFAIIRSKRSSMRRRSVSRSGDNMIPVTSAIVSAIDDALAEYNLHITTIPVDPVMLLGLIEGRFKARPEETDGARTR